MTTSLARRFKVDVSADGISWLPFKGITDFAPKENPTMQSTADYDNDGFDSSEKTLTGWAVTVKAHREMTSGVFDPGQELVRARQFKFDELARAYIRYYDRNGAPEAKQGRAVVAWDQTKTGVADIEEVTATFTGDGAIVDIENPITNTNNPVVSSASPTGAVEGSLINIQGAYFTGTIVSTGVTIGGVDATTWDVVSDSLIVAQIPAGSAGSAPIVVTNANGVSNSLPYTRGA